MIPWGLDGSHATDVRPPHVSATKAWAKDESAPGANDGTRYTSSVVNRLLGNIRMLGALAGVALTQDGDEDLANSVIGLIGLTPPKEHTHNDLYYTIGQLDSALGAIDTAIVQLSAELHNQGDIKLVENLAAAADMTGLSNGDLIHVVDNGDGKWARYQVTVSGDGSWADSTKVVIWTQDQAPSSHGHNVADLFDASEDSRSLLQAANYAAMKLLLALEIGDVSGLSAALAEKVPIAQIVDNLASSDADRPLSAAQGKELKDLLDALAVSAALPRGYLSGLQVTQSGNTISIAPGCCRSDDDAENIVLAAALTGKNYGASWGAGSASGLLQASLSTAANTWYHVYLIKNSATGVVDAMCCPQGTAVVLPTGFDTKRRVCSFVTNGGSSIRPFLQLGDTFMFKTPVADIASGSVGTSSQNVTLTVPLGVQVEAIINMMASKAGEYLAVFMRSPGLDNVVPSLSSPAAFTHGAAYALGTVTVPFAGTATRIVTDTNSQIAVRADTAGATLWVATFGWRDFLGRHD